MSSETAGSPGLGLCTVCVRDVESKVGWKSGRWVSCSCLFLHSFIDSAVVFHAPIPDGQNCILKAAGGCWLCTAALVRLHCPSPGIAQILFGFSGRPESSLALRARRWPLWFFHGSVVSGQDDMPPSGQGSRLALCGPLLGTLEKARAPHSSSLAWKIPWTDEPGRLQSMGS